MYMYMVSRPKQSNNNNDQLLTGLLLKFTKDLLDLYMFVSFFVIEMSQTLSDRYIGCYIDQIDRTLPFRMDFYSTSTIEICSSFCASNYFTFAGIEVNISCTNVNIFVNIEVTQQRL